MFHPLRQQQVLEVKGMVGNDYSVSLTAPAVRWPPRGMRYATRLRNEEGCTVEEAGRWTAPRVNQRVPETRPTTGSMA